MCPFLVSVLADRLWLYPVSAYCRRPDSRVRVPAPATMTQFCASTSYRRCPGYLLAVGNSPPPPERRRPGRACRPGEATACAATYA